MAGLQNRSANFNGTRSLAIAMLFVVALLGYSLWSEVAHLRRSDPKGINSFVQFYDRFGSSHRALEGELNGSNYYILSGPLPPKGSLAIVSAPPEYVFDDQGNFVDYCPDPGESLSWGQKWSLNGQKDISDSDIRKRFGL